jgi:hypothetical protein
MLEAADAASATGPVAAARVGNSSRYLSVCSLELGACCVSKGRIFYVHVLLPTSWHDIVVLTKFDPGVLFGCCHVRVADSSIFAP